MSNTSQENTITKEVTPEHVSQTMPAPNTQSKETPIVPEYYKSRKDNKFASIDGLFNIKS